jgi:plastocyanin
MFRRRWYVLAILATGVTAIAAFAPAALGTSNAKYTVTATDFKFKLLPLQLKAGTQTVTVVNRGQATHDFKIGTKAKSWKTRILNNGQRETITITLKKGVRYTYLCTVPGHAQLGMKKTVLIP